MIKEDLKKSNESIIFLFFSVVLFLASCSPARQISRIQKKNPEFFERNDTTISFSSKEIIRDTVFFSKTEIKRDTFIIDSIGFIYINRTIQGDSIGFNINIPPDTSKVSVIRYKVSIEDDNKLKQNIFNLVLLICGLYFLSLIVKLIVSRWNKS